MSTVVNTVKNTEPTKANPATTVASLVTEAKGVLTKLAELEAQQKSVDDEKAKLKAAYRDLFSKHSDVDGLKQIAESTLAEQGDTIEFKGLNSAIVESFLDKLYSFKGKL